MCPGKRARDASRSLAAGGSVCTCSNIQLNGRNDQFGILIAITMIVKITCTHLICMTNYDNLIELHNSYIVHVL